MAAAAPRRIEIVPWGQPKSVSGMTWTRTQASGNLGGGSAGQNGAADADDGDSVSWDVLLDSGTWAIDIIHLKGTTFGILDVNLGGASLGTVDGYNGSSTDDNVATISSISVSTAGHYTLTVAINGKHASATDYLMGLQLIVLRRTGA